MSKRLSGLTIPELKTVADNEGITSVTETDSKDEIIEKIIEYRFVQKSKSTIASAKTSTPAPPIVDPEIEKLRLEVEKRKLDIEEAKIEASKEKDKLEHERLMKEIDLKSKSPASPTVKKIPEGQLPLLKEGDDIQAYLDTCDRLVENHGWSEEVSATKLAEKVRGKARLAFARLPLTDTKSYSKIKAAILKCYDLTPDSLRKNFRCSSRKSGESHSEWAIRLKDYLARWLNSETVTNLDEVREMVICEQFLNKVSPELQGRLKEQKFKNVQEMADFSDRFAAAHGWKRSEYKGFKHKSPPRPDIDKHQADSSSDSETSESEKDSSDKASPKDVSENKRTSKELCPYCSKGYHAEEKCHKKARDIKNGEFCGLASPISKLNPDLFLQGSIADSDVTMYRDSGSSITFVNSKFVNSKHLLNKRTFVTFANGSYDLVPLAKIKLSFRNRVYSLTVGVMETPIDVILGRDYERLIKKQVNREFKETTHSDRGVQSEQSKESLLKFHVFGNSLAEFRKLQKECPTLTSCWSNVNSVTYYEKSKSFFTIQDGLLFRVWQGKSRSVTQIVVPEVLRNRIIEKIHLSDGLKHLGIYKTKLKISSICFWPAMFTSISSVIRSCSSCYKLKSCKSDELKSTSTRAYSVECSSLVTPRVDTSMFKSGKHTKFKYVI